MNLDRLLRHLLKKPVTVVYEDRAPEVKIIRDTRLAKMIINSEKFSLNTMPIADKDNLLAINETAGDMIQYGIFHLPHRLTLVEDIRPIRNGQAYYLCEEQSDSKIKIYFIEAIDRPNKPWLTLVHAPTEIDLTDGRLTIGKIGEPLETLKNAFHEVVLFSWMRAALAVRFLVVLLDTAKHHAVKCKSVDKIKVPGATRSQQYFYTAVRAPLPSESITEGNRRSPKAHLVRGYIRGKDKPRHQQTWVKPYFRGSMSDGMAKRTHYKFEAGFPDGEDEAT